MCDLQMASGPPIASQGILIWDAATNDLKILLIFVNERQKLECFFSLIRSHRNPLD